MAKDDAVASTPTATEPAGPQLYMITVAGLQVKLDWAAVHDRLLDDFAQIRDVLATTMPETLLIVYEGEDDIDGRFDGVSDGILGRRLSPGKPRHAAKPMQARRREPSTSRPERTGPRLNPKLAATRRRLEKGQRPARRQAELTYQLIQSSQQAKG